MKREFLTTKDGSITIHLPEWNEQYHSKHGAINEAIHVFINTGLKHLVSKNVIPEISVLEIGFGTGLNALLTYRFAEENNQYISYSGIEAYPVAVAEALQLNYPILTGIPKNVFNQLHQSPWGIEHPFSTYFKLIKRKQFFEEISAIEEYHLIYFDAFGARVQPELWTEHIFMKMYQALKIEGVMVTYAAKGSVRRAMQAVGFTVERLPGPPGKREMLRAIK